MALLEFTRMRQERLKSVVRRAKKDLRPALRHLKAARDLLATVVGYLPASAAEAATSPDLASLDDLTELNAVIACVMQDSLRPAIEDLQTVAGRRAP